MSKLLKLKDWLTLDDAARHLSMMFDEAVTEADILRLALDDWLTLSVNFVNETYARMGSVKEAVEARHIDVPTDFAAAMKAQTPGEYGGGWKKLCMGIPLEGTTQVIELEDEIVSLHGVYDLPMIGGERLDIEQRFLRMTGGPETSAVPMDGAFVLGAQGQLLQLQEHYDANPYRDPASLKKPWAHRENFYPGGRLPADAILIVRTDVLADLRTRIARGTHEGELKGALSTRERDTLLKLVIGMAIAGYRYSPGAARSEAPSEIASDLAKQGMSMTDDTVRKWLKEAAKTVLPEKPPTT